MLYIIRLDLTPAQIDGVTAYNRATIADAKKLDPEGKGPERTTLPTHEWVKAGLLKLVADHIPAEEPTATEKAAALEDAGDLKGALEVLKAELSAKGKAR